MRGEYIVRHPQIQRLEADLNRYREDGYEIASLAMGNNRQHATVVLRRAEARSRNDATPMTQAEFNALDTGDVVRHVEAWQGDVVHQNYGDHGVLIARTQLIHNPREWELVRKVDE